MSSKCVKSVKPGIESGVLKCHESLCRFRSVSVLAQQVIVKVYLCIRYFVIIQFLLVSNQAFYTSVLNYGQSLRRGQIATNTMQQSKNERARHSQLEEKVRILTWS